VFLIENKIFSDKGWRQTERYANPEFKENLTKYIEFEPDAEINYFFSYS